MENDSIRVFLESPRTLEPISEIDIKPPRTRTLKRKEKLPPYIPFKNIFEETDLSKLTERQRILALKYQSTEFKPSSLFLAVNDVNFNHKKCKNNCIEDSIKLQKFLKWFKTRSDKKDKINCILKRLKEVKLDSNCICEFEDEIYKNVLKLK